MIYPFAIVWDVGMILQFYCKTITDGKKDKGVSETGVKFYNDLINELIANGQNNSNHI